MDPNNQLSDLLKMKVSYEFETYQNPMNELLSCLVKEILALSPNAKQDVREPSGPSSHVGLTKPPTKAVACNPRNLRVVIDSDILPGDAVNPSPTNRISTGFLCKPATRRFLGAARRFEVDSSPGVSAALLY